GGHFERIFSSEMTAEKLIISYGIKIHVDQFVRRFTSLRKKAQASENTEAIYARVLGASLAKRHITAVQQVMPQCSVFLCGIIYKDLVELGGMDPSKILDSLKTNGDSLIQ